MAHPNDGFRPPLPNPPFASTPNSNRTQRPRFAYSGPQNYPRPGSSASKPNPDFSVSDIMRSRYIPPGHMNDSMVNNYGDSYMDTSLPSYDNSFQSEYNSEESFQSQDSVYYSANESFNNSPRKPFPSSQYGRPQHPYQANFFEPDTSMLPPISNRPVRFKSVSSVVDPNKRKPFYKKKDVKGIGVVSKKHDDGISKHVWRCSLCDIVFTSSIPYNMHKQGTKHAKKLKLQEATQTVQSQVKSTKGKEVEVAGTTFRCELCGIIANSPYQLKMHFEGIKHKTKVLQQKEEAEKSNAETKKAKQKTDGEKDTKVNGNKEIKGILKKTEATVTKPAGCPTKTAFSCAICELFLNSDAQLQQHLLGKYHKAKVEGTTLPFHAKKKAAIRKAADSNEPCTTEEKKVVELEEFCEGNQAEESSKTDKDVQSDTVLAFFLAETAKDGQPEASKDNKPETSDQDIKAEIFKDNQAEITKDIQSEKASVVAPEKAKAD